MSRHDFFKFLAIGMGLGEVAAVAGEPEKREVYLEGETWSYPAFGVEIDFSGEEKPKVSRIIIKALKPK